ncbi:hypothetical protein V1509DRAFT_628269 [Lipomyces kononenkoae]
MKLRLQSSPALFASGRHQRPRDHHIARDITTHFLAAGRRLQSREERDGAGPWIGDRCLVSVYRRFFSSSKIWFREPSTKNGGEELDLAIGNNKNSIGIEKQAKLSMALERAVDAAAERAGMSKRQLKALVAEYMTPGSAIGMTVIQDPDEPFEEVDSIWASDPEWDKAERLSPSEVSPVSRTDNRTPLRRILDYLSRLEMLLAEQMPSFDRLGRSESNNSLLKPGNGYYDVIYHSEYISTISEILHQQLTDRGESEATKRQRRSSKPDVVSEAIGRLPETPANTFVERLMSVLEFYVGDARLPEGYEKRLNAVELRLQLMESTISREDLIEAMRFLYKQEQPDHRMAELVVGHLCSHGMFTEIMSLTLRLFDFAVAQEIIRFALFNRVANPNFAFADIFRACISSGRGNFGKHLLAEVYSEVDRNGRNFLTDKYGPQDIQSLEEELMARAQLELAMMKMDDKKSLQSLITEHNTRSFILENESTFVISLLQLARVEAYSDMIALFEASTFPDVSLAIQEIAKRLPLFLERCMVHDEFVERFTLIAAKKLHDMNASCGCLAPIAQMANVNSLLRLWNAVVYCDPVTTTSSSPMAYDGLPKNQELLTPDLVRAFGIQAMHLKKWDTCVRILRTKTTGRVRSQIDPAFIATIIEKVLTSADNSSFSKLTEEAAIRYAADILASQVGDTSRKAVLIITERFLTGQVVITKEKKGQVMTLLMGTLQRAGYYVSNPYAANILAIVKQTSTNVQEDIIQRYGSLLIPTHLRQLVFEHIDRNRATGDYNENVIYAFIEQAIRHKTSTRSKVNSSVIATLKSMFRSERPTAPSRRNSIYTSAPNTVDNSDAEVLKKRANHAIRLVGRLHREWPVGKEITYWLLQSLILHRQFEPAIKALQSTRKTVYPQLLFEIFQTTAIVAGRPEVALQARYEELVRYDHQRRAFVERLLRMTYGLLEDDGRKGLQGEWGVRYWSALLFRTIGKKDSTAAFTSSLIRGTFNDASRQLTSNLNNTDARLTKASMQIVDDARFSHALDWTVLSSANDWNFSFTVWHIRLQDLYLRAKSRAAEEELQELTRRYEDLCERLRYYEELSLWWSKEFRLILKGPRRWAKVHIEEAVERSKRK